MVARRPGTADSRLGPNGKRVMDAVEDYLESCAQVIVDIEVVERLLRPEDLEVSLRFVLKRKKAMTGKPGKKWCTAGD